MTSETRQRLAIIFTDILIPARAGGVRSSSSGRSPHGGKLLFSTTVQTEIDPDQMPLDPDLTPFQTMCLAGLLGDPGQLESAVVDYCIDSGVDVVTAAFERGKLDERERCVELLREESARRASPMSWMRGEDEVLGEAADIISSQPAGPPAHATGRHVETDMWYSPSI